MAQGHLEALKNMETRLVKRNFSMPGLPLLSHFCVFFYHNHYYFYHKTRVQFLLFGLNSKFRRKNKKKKKVVERAIQFTQF